MLGSYDSLLHDQFYTDASSPFYPSTLYPSPVHESRLHEPSYRDPATLFSPSVHYPFESQFYDFDLVASAAPSAFTPQPLPDFVAPDAAYRLDGVAFAPDSALSVPVAHDVYSYSLLSPPGSLLDSPVALNPTPANQAMSSFSFDSIAASSMASPPADPLAVPYSAKIVDIPSVTALPTPPPMRRFSADHIESPAFTLVSLQDVSPNWCGPLDATQSAAPVAIFNSPPAVVPASDVSVDSVAPQQHHHHHHLHDYIVDPCHSTVLASHRMMPTVDLREPVQTMLVPYPDPSVLTRSSKRKRVGDLKIDIPVKAAKSLEHVSPNPPTPLSDSTVDDHDHDHDDDEDALSPQSRFSPVSLKYADLSQGEKKFTCPEPDCQRTFKRAEHLARHSRVHTGERPYACDFPGCTRMFSRADNMKAHKKTHASYPKATRPKKPKA